MPLNGVKNIILVLSGKGGVGKSSVTLQLALALCRQSHSVGILDIDLTGPSIPRLVGKEDARVTQAAAGWVPVTVHDAMVVNAPMRENTTEENGAADGDMEGSTTARNGHSTNDKDSTSGQDSRPWPREAGAEQSSISIGPLKTMSLGFILPSRSSAVIWRGPKKTAMIRQFLSSVNWGETDYLLVDTPPGTGDEHIALAEELLKLGETDPETNLLGAVVVTTPQAVSTSDVRKELNFCEKVGIHVLGVVENMSGFMCPCCGEVSNVFSKGGGEIMATESGVPFLGRVPVDMGFGELVEVQGDSQRPLVDRYGDSRLSDIFGGFAAGIKSG